MNHVQIGVLLGVIFTIGAIVFGITIYAVMVQVNENIAYMALYYDDVATENLNNSDVAIWASSQAWRWCELYRAEQRTLDWERYFNFCDEIAERHKNLVMCQGGVCDVAREQLQGPERAHWEFNTPYLRYVFSDDYRPVKCGIGRDPAPCPGD